MRVRARQPIREWFWRMLCRVFVPIARFVDRRRMTACGCFACSMNLRRPEIERQLVKDMQAAFAQAQRGPAIHGGDFN